MVITEQMWTAFGWVGTAIFVASFLVKNRSLLHLLGFVGCIIKLFYTLHYSLWPLVVNWLLLIAIEFVQWVRYRKDDTKPSIEECIKCGQ